MTDITCVARAAYRNAVVCCCVLLLTSCVAVPSGLSYQTESGKPNNKEYQSYLLYLPSSYYLERKRRWPLLVYLHGYGDINNMKSLTSDSLPKILETTRDLQFVVVCPHMTVREEWNPGKLERLVSKICDEYSIDRKRLYLTGISWGGTGAWAMVLAYPRLFAAVAPVCGLGGWYSSQDIAASVGPLPIWVFHGAKDPMHSPANVVKMVDELRSLGTNIEFTLYPDMGHEIWDQTYSNPRLYQWFLEQVRESR